MNWTHDTNFLGWMEEAGGDAGGSGGGDTPPEGGQQSGGGTTLLDGDPGDPGQPQDPQAPPQPTDGGTQEPFFRGLYDEQGTINKDRLDLLPEELKPFRDTLERYDSVESLIRGFMNTKQLASGKGLEPLSPNASDEAKEEFGKTLHKLTGAPEKPEDYGLKKPDDYPEDLPWSDERVGKYAEILHKHHASPELAQELLQAQVEEGKGIIGETQAAVEEQIKTGLKELENVAKEEGRSVSDITQNAKRALKSLNWEGFDASHPAMRDPNVIRVLDAYAATLFEDDTGGLGSGSTGGEGGSYRDQALDIVNNPDNKWHKHYHDTEGKFGADLHEQAIQRKQELDRMHTRRQRGG